MKLSYNPKTQQYQVTELGKLIDSDADFEALGTRQGFLSEDDGEDFDPFVVVEADEDE